MASAHVEWAPFAKEMGWAVQPTSRKYPIGDWAKEKKEELASEQAQVLASMVFHEKSRWHEEVLKTLRDYPEANNVLLAIIKKRLSDIVGMIRQDEANKSIKGYQSQFAKVKNSELMTLAAAIKTLTESRHKSLLLDKWSFAITDSHVEDTRLQIEDEESAGWKVEIMGSEKGSDDMQELLAKWYDKPHMPSESGDA